MKFYVTTPIYYVNDIPHIGHAYTTITADVIARYKRLCGFDVFFLTGTDEHGRKVEKAAEERGISPKELADEVHVRFKELWKVLNIEYSRFIRTTEREHRETVAEIWRRIEARGDIYLGTYSGWYCVPCETFWSTSQLANGKCPSCEREVEKLDEPSFFFRVSNYVPELTKIVQEDFVKPDFRKREVLGILRNLQDISISRLRTRVKWGIPVPSNPDHTIYVWFDALINYVTGCGFPDIGGLWPADIHIVGKDILKFHAVFWPMFLMSSGLDIPKKVFAHGWWRVLGQKMSKSLKNVVDPFELSEVFGSDAVRYFMLREVPFGYDGDFSEEAIIRRYNNDLAKDFGNLVLRSFTMVQRYLDGRLGMAEYKDIFGLIREVIKNWGSYVEGMKFSDALSEVWRVVSELNRYIDRSAPWALHKKSETQKLLEVLYNIIEGIRVVCCMFIPFCPATSYKVLESMGITQEKLKTALSEFGLEGFLMKRWEYHVLSNPGILFPKLD